MEYLKDKLIKKGNYYLLNKEMVRQLGAKDAMYLTHLIDMQPKLAHDVTQGFYQYSYQFEAALGIKQRTQYRISDRLVAKGLMSTETKKQSNIKNNRTKYFYLNAKTIIKQFNIYNTKDTIKQAILDEGNYWIISKNIIEKIGINATLYLTLIMEMELLIKKPESEVYMNVGWIKEKTHLSRYKQNEAIDKLVQRKIVTTYFKIINGERHKMIKLNYNNILLL